MMAGLTYRITAEQRPAMYQRKRMPMPDPEKVLVLMPFPMKNGYVMAEFEDGHCEIVHFTDLRFLDSKDKFGNWCWDQA